MAVPSSGQLQLSKIFQEVDNDDYDSVGSSPDNVSLKNLSDGTVDTINTANDSADRPDVSVPHKMSEFYSYDHDLAVGWTWTWDNNVTHHYYPHISGSRGTQNTAPTQTVADQFVMTASLVAHSTDAFDQNDGHGPNKLVCWIATSGSSPRNDIGFVIGKNEDPGTSGTGGKAPGFKETTSDPPRGTDWVNNSHAIAVGDGTYFIRLYASGSGNGSPGDSYVRELWIGNGPYSSSVNFTAHVVS